MVADITTNPAIKVKLTKFGEVCLRLYESFVLTFAIVRLNPILIGALPEIYTRSTPLSYTKNLITENNTNTLYVLYYGKHAGNM